MNRIGVLALQGGFGLHAKKIAEFGGTAVEVRKKEQLSGLSGLAIPGGESSVLLHLADQAFRDAISERVRDGLPVLATCAGLIFISDKVENPQQESLGLLPVSVKRNAYGRQRDSFIARQIPWEAGPASAPRNNEPPLAEAVFIRAPRIVACDAGVEVLVRWEGDPILVKHRNVIGSTFHPELASEGCEIHRLAFG